MTYGTTKHGETLKYFISFFLPLSIPPPRFKALSMVPRLSQLFQSPSLLVLTPSDSEPHHAGSEPLPAGSKRFSADIEALYGAAAQSFPNSYWFNIKETGEAKRSVPNNNNNNNYNNNNDSSNDKSRNR